jgi:DNA-binding IclR family transcriptional regulator
MLSSVKKALEVLIKKYRLGLKIIDLANRALCRFDIRDHAAPLMKK